MTETMKKPVQITETVLRDAHQSLIATRMTTEEMLPIVPKLDEIGYRAVECWGGATFDAALRFLHEDPWDRLRKFKDGFKKTKLQMLFRGQNILGYSNYPDDVVEYFVQKSVANGIDIIRIFDALNDLRNIEVAVDEAVKCGAHVQGAVSYTTSPIHTLENYVELAKKMEAMGCHSICIKDMAGIMGPQEAYDLVSAIKAAVKLPIVLHTHSTTGLGPMTLLKAVEAGATTIDTAISCLSGGTAQPATESMHYALKQMGYDSGLDEKLLKEINDFFRPIKTKFEESGQLTTYVLGTETDALVYQVPGGMLSNLISQLKGLGESDRLNDVLAEVPKVRADLGYPPLVTPSSQMVGVQATQNVLMGERYKTVTKEIRAYLRGEYGRAPGEVNKELQKKVLGDEQPITCRFADLLEPMMEKTAKELGSRAKSEEDVLSYIAFPQVAEKFFEAREEKERNTVKYTIKEI